MWGCVCVEEEHSIGLVGLGACTHTALTATWAGPTPSIGVYETRADSIKHVLSKSSFNAQFIRDGYNSSR